MCCKTLSKEKELINARKHYHHLPKSMCLQVPWWIWNIHVLLRRCWYSFKKGFFSVLNKNMLDKYVTIFVVMHDEWAARGVKWPHIYLSAHKVRYKLQNMSVFGWIIIVKSLITIFQNLKKLRIFYSIDAKI